MGPSGIFLEVLQRILLTRPASAQSGCLITDNYQASLASPCNSSSTAARLQPRHIMLQTSLYFPAVTPLKATRPAAFFPAAPAGISGQSTFSCKFTSEKKVQATGQPIFRIENLSAIQANFAAILDLLSGASSVRHRPDRE
jgi:hypothetical protein